MQIYERTNLCAYISSCQSTKIGIEVTRIKIAFFIIFINLKRQRERERTAGKREVSHTRIIR